MRFNLIILIYLFTSCTTNYTKIDNRKPYNAKGFAYIFNQVDKEKNIIKGKMNNDLLEISHSQLKYGATIKLINPKTKDTIVLKNTKKIKYPEFYKIVISDAVANKLNIDRRVPLIEVLEIRKNKSFVAKKKFDLINKKFPNKVGLIHGSLSKDEKDDVLKKFLNNKISILVSTTVIEVGIDFPNANLIIIENANKFGLAQLHQLRGRVGRGSKESTCILLFKEGLSKNSIQRIKILKKSDDGFYIAEEDLKLRGFGDLLGYQQSGIKTFRFADPLLHQDLFKLAERFILNQNEKINEKKYDFLLKLFDKAEIINVNDF